MVDALVSGVIDQLISISRASLQKEVKMVVGVKGDIEKLETTFRAIQAVIEDAESQQVSKKEVQLWLAELKNAAYDADDILDEWMTIIGMKNKVHTGLFLRFKSAVKSPFVCHGIGYGIREINERLDVISDGMKKFKFKLGRKTDDRTGHLQHRITSSLVHESDIFGRTHDKEVIINKLLGENSSSNLSPVTIISIVGMGGIGKTTLAQLVFSDEIVKTSFDKIMWVCVSEPFDKVRVAKAIIEALDGHVSGVVEWDALHSHLSKSLKGRHFLLVLDDVWTEDYAIWEPLELCLRGGAHGSKIVVTTRNEKVGLMIGSTHIYKLAGLSEEECWSLFSRRAFMGRTEEEKQILEEIGKKITQKCKGLPLAAKAIGALMQFKKKRQDWQNVLESASWAETSVLPVLLMSYYDLSPQLRRCFVFFAVYPQDYTIHKKDVIKLWMANGFLNCISRKCEEVIGKDFFDTLVARCFLQKRGRSYKMHDLIHEFACFLANNECLSFKITKNYNSPAQVSVNVRHLHVETDDRIIKLPSPICSTMTTLRTLDYKAIMDADSASTILNFFKSLRALDLSHTCLKILPNGVEKLKHLRFLDLSHNKELEELPDTVCNLYNLQTLDLRGCIKLKSMPKGIGNLVNLRHLLLDDFRGGILPEGIGRLSSLQTLRVFDVGSSEIRGFAKIAEVKNLNELRQLQIDGLSGVASGKEAIEAQLVEKQYLSFLRLSFGPSRLYARFKAFIKLENIGAEEMEREEGILDSLEPPPHLETLAIRLYGGSRIPSWMESDIISFKLGCLQSLHIQQCPNLEAAHHQSFPDTLTNLYIEHCPKLSWTSMCLPPSLEKLSLKGDAGVLSRSFSIICLHPNHNKLKTLNILASEKSLLPEGFRQHLPMLQTLEVHHGCHKLARRCAGKGAPDWDIISHIPNIIVSLE